MTRRSLSVLLLVMVIAGCGGSDDAKGPTATVGTSSTESTTTTTKALTPEEEVEAAYLKSWDVYAKAVRTYDLTGVEDVYAQKALEALRSDVARYKREHHTVVVKVDHNYGVKILEPGMAAVSDSYVNHSVLSDSEGRPLEPDPNETLSEIYTLRRIDGLWKVVGFDRL